MQIFSESEGQYPHNQAVLTVSEISRAVKSTLEQSFDRVLVRGEISGFKRAASGHLYLALKDENAVLDGVCWRGTAQRLGLRPEDGMEVIARGRITSYPARSKYQIVIDSLELAGEGALLKLLEARKKALAAEGLFEESRKRPLPYLPQVIGVVTSPTGAVIRDILHRLADRFPRRVLLWPVLVQGEGAAAQVAAAIEGFNRLEPGAGLPRPDLLIVARGGGSLEDLWAFNEEIVVRAAAASEIPLISAVGHETDTTLIDFAADRRAPTPSAAAEIAVPVRAELVSHIQDRERRLLAALRRRLAEAASLVEGLARGLPDPARLVGELAQRLDDRGERFEIALRTGLRQRANSLREWGNRLPHPGRQIGGLQENLQGQAERLERRGRRLVREHRQSFAELNSAARLRRAWQRQLRQRGDALAALGRILEGTSYQSALKRGFTVVRHGGKVVMRAQEVAAGQDLEIEFADGRLAARAAGKSAAPGAGGRTTRKNAPAKDPQGRLL